MIAHARVARITFMEKESYVYIMTNRTHGVLYTGVTGDIGRRVSQHKAGTGGQFTKKYKVTKLIYVEIFSDIRDAIAREKQIKGGSRSKKIELIETMNPEWRDLSEDLV
jgi:putative endonuclease